MKQCNFLVKKALLGKPVHWCTLYSPDLHYIGKPGGCTEKFHPACYVDKQTERKEKIKKLKWLME